MHVDLADVPLAISNYFFAVARTLDCAVGLTSVLLVHLVKMHG